MKKNSRLSSLVSPLKEDSRLSSLVSPLKIVVTGTRGIPNIMGGVETHCEQLFPIIAAMGFDVTVIRRKSYVIPDNSSLSSPVSPPKEDSPLSSPVSPLKEDSSPSSLVSPLKEWNGVKLVDIDTPKSKALEAVVHTYRSICRAKKLGADVVHIHAIGPALLTPLAKLLGMKVVFTHHGPDYDRDKWGAVAKAALRLGERMGCTFADDVIVISDVIRQLVVRKYGRTDRVHLIYNGVPEPDICEFPEYFSQLGIEQGKYILAVCRFVPEKNMHHLVEAFSRIDAHGCRLVLAGDTDFEDDYSRSLKEEAHRHGVVLTGFIRGKKLHSLLSHCRCYCLPSSHEGLPISLLEAMSYGARVVVSDIPANLEVGLPSHDYFHTGDIDALATKLQTASDEPYSRISYDMSKYDWNQIAAQVAKIYSSYR